MNTKALDVNTQKCFFLIFRASFIQFKVDEKIRSQCRHKVGESHTHTTEHNIKFIFTATFSSVRLFEGYKMSLNFIQVENFFILFCRSFNIKYCLLIFIKAFKTMIKMVLEQK